VFFALNSTVTEGADVVREKKGIDRIFFIRKIDEASGGGELIDRLSSHFEIESLRGGIHLSVKYSEDWKTCGRKSDLNRKTMALRLSRGKVNIPELSVDSPCGGIR
jgi:hypothetical protein